MKKGLTIVGALIIVLFVLSLFIQKETKPSDNTRVIIEHTYSTYVAPPCFNDADVTNFLEDSTLGAAIDMGYDPHDSCTEDAYKSEKESFFVSLLKDIGFLQKKWDKW